MVGKRILIEFGHPLHKKKPYNIIDQEKNKFATMEGYKLLRFTLSDDIIDAIILIEENLTN